VKILSCLNVLDSEFLFFNSSITAHKPKKKKKKASDFSPLLRSDLLISIFLQAAAHSTNERAIMFRTVVSVCLVWFYSCSGAVATTFSIKRDMRESENEVALPLGVTAPRLCDDPNRTKRM
jgi:hypothetical protein